MMPHKRKRATPPVAEESAHALDPETMRSEDLLRRVIGSLPALVYRCKPGPERTVEYISLGCRTLTGFDPVDLVGNRVVSYGELIHPDDRSRVLQAVTEALGRGDTFTITYRVRRVDGRHASVREHGIPVRGASGEVEAIEGLIVAVQGMTEDELERNALEVAHDLNNVLAAIKTTAELALIEGRDPTLVADLEEIVSATLRGAALGDRLRHVTPPSVALPSDAPEASE